MAKIRGIYKCNICGNIVSVLHEGAGELICCGQPMQLLQEKTKDIGFEKHIPIIEKSKKGFIVKVGKIPHPMESGHYIEWIEGAGEKGEIARIFLKPGDKPEAEFCFKVVSARELCNLHGLWKTS
jgi:superoxide reductase